MKRLSIFLLLFIFLLQACTSPAAPTDVPASELPPTSPPESDEGVHTKVVIQILSENLGIEENSITVKSETSIEFGNACLDVVLPDSVCAEVVTPGRKIILEANGIEYEYRTTDAGDVIHPATRAMTWTREGGIAGFCDRLVVYLSGEVYASNCRSQPAETSGTFTRLLTAARQNQFTGWYLKFGKTTLDISDPAGVSDQMTNILEFSGQGNGKPGKADQQAMFDWASELYQKLNS